MNHLKLVQSGELTMSSKEIADLVEARHDNVKRTIETLAAKGVIAFPQSEEKATGGRPSIEYIFSGTKGKRDSLIVVAQLCPEFTARIVDRWQRLEEEKAGGGFRLPDFSNPAIAARAWADQFERSRQLEAKVEEQAPKVAALDRLKNTDGLMCLRDTAKALGVSERKVLIPWLTANKWLYRHGHTNRLMGHARVRDLGYVDHKCVTIHGSNGDREVANAQITAKGLAKLAEVFAVGGDQASLFAA